MRYRTRNRYGKPLAEAHVTDPSRIHGGGTPGEAHIRPGEKIYWQPPTGEAHVSDPSQIHGGGMQGEAHAGPHTQIHYAPPQGEAHVGHHLRGLAQQIAMRHGYDHPIARHLDLLAHHAEGMYF